MNGIARELEMSTSTVQKYFRRQDEAKIDWGKSQSMKDAELERALQPQKRLALDYAEPDWRAVYLAMRKKPAPTLLSLWGTYKAGIAADGGKPLGYSAFARNFARFRASVPEDLSEYASVFEYKAGEITEIDYSGGGHGVCVTDPVTGIRREVQVFVAVLPCSNLCFFHATAGQTRDDWLDAMTLMMEYFGGSTRYIDLDNSTSLVIRASRFSPKCCSEFKAFCEHYGTTPFPVRPNEPRDKAHVEGAVRLCQERCLSAMKGMKFFSLEEVNRELRRLCDAFNERQLCQMAAESRRSLFESEERPFLNPLPPEPWEPSMIIKKLKVRKDGIIKVDGRRYRVPYKASGTQVRVLIFPRRGRLTVRSLDGAFLAEHDIRGDGGITSMPEFMPPAVQYVLETPEKKIGRLAEAGPFSKRMAESVGSVRAKRVACKRLTGLQTYLDKLGAERFEKCSRAAVEDGVTDYDGAERYYRSELKARTARRRLPRGAALDVPAPVRNIRGPEAYGKGGEE